jgi:hypothetical protein
MFIYYFRNFQILNLGLLTDFRIHNGTENGEYLIGEAIYCMDPQDVARHPLFQHLPVNW